MDLYPHVFGEPTERLQQRYESSQQYSYARRAGEKHKRYRLWQLALVAILPALVVALILSFSAHAEGFLLLEGSHGPAVARVQSALQIRADGNYEAQTEGAVTAFQKRNGLLVDGIVGPQTEQALFGRVHGASYSTGPQVEVQQIHAQRVSHTTQYTHASTTGASSGGGGSCYSGSPVPASVVSHESGGSPTVTNSSGHYGCYQIGLEHWNSGGACSGMGKDVAGQKQCAAAVLRTEGPGAWAQTWGR